MLTDAGRRRLLELRVNKVPGRDLVLLLYSNEVTPDPGVQLKDLVEVTGGGYLARTLTGKTWKLDAKADPDGRFIIRHPTEVFRFTAVPTIPTIWGYGITHDDVLVAVDFVLDGRPCVITLVGDELEVTPALYDKAD